MNKDHHNGTTRGDVAKAVLLLAGTIALIPIAAAVGNGIQVIPAITKFFKKKPTKRQEYYISETIVRLERLGYLERAGEYLKLTDRGKEKLSQLDVLPVPNKWDKKFRVIIFDVPVDKNKLRNAIRRQLSVWGFKRIQQSVWVYPYECREVVALLKTRFGLGKDVLYMVVDEIENDRWLKIEFNLPT